ncbi:MAG: nucleoside 2-deoxyribosyltransferase [Candidatus Aenigmarchaeota archaeon]|nr:nucleoside 2-deoxyribosyltransferase [Candidatus Aenigmarchaeota archaeon]
MKTIFLAGSRTCSQELEQMFSLCKSAEIHATKGRDSLNTANEQEAHRTMMQRIDSADIVYVVASNGYVGKTVAFEIGYAAAKGKEIIASEPLAETGLNSVIAQILSSEQCIAYAKT